jgi:hypothetical protein
MKTTIDMARETKMPYDFVTGEPINLEKLKAFEALVRADERDRAMRENAYVQAEREACAKVADLVAREIDDSNGIATYIAAAIRARSNT